MASWDGVGLPPIARARIERAKSSSVRTSLLSVAGQLGVDSCGLQPIGEVMGCVVEHIGFQGYGGCGWTWGMGMMTPTTITNRSGGYFGFGPFLEALNAGWNGALGRMTAECQALGGDGIVDIRLTERHLGDGDREFIAMGTAVRSTQMTHLSRPFTTTLQGQEVAKLISSGYVPVQAIVAISVGIRHDDFRTRQAVMAFSANVEVPGYTDLVHTVRSEVRRELAVRAAQTGADGAILSSPMRMSIHELEVGENHRDHVAESSLVATAIARFADGGPSLTRPLTYLPLR
jgi:uncharacterized protein YbjQ (UPF0145 family)